ncbi:hypothetical protein KAU11_12545, partial [Candidatus Babeliales bacterium]|nr:hypothetical protein [Candidatus Babeliales bacterium]
SDFFDGILDEVRLYNSALSSKEIASLSSSSPVSSIFYKNSQDILKRPEGSSIIAHYSFDEDTPYIVRDASGCRQNGVFFKKNLKNFSVGIKASSFDSSVLKNSIGIKDTIYQRKLSLLTISLWVHPSDFSPKQKLVIKQGIDNPLEFYLIGVDDGHLYGGIGDGKDMHIIKDINKMDKNKWQHVAMVIDQDKNGIFLYRNGIPAAQSMLQKKITFSSQSVSPLVIGSSSSQKEDFFTGKIDEVSIFSTAVSPKNIQLLSKFMPEKEKTIEEDKKKTDLAKKDKGRKKKAKDKKEKERMEKEKRAAAKKKEAERKKKKKEQDLDKEKAYQRELALYKKKIEDLKNINDQEKEKQKQLEKENQEKIAVLQNKLVSKEQEQTSKEKELRDLIEKEKTRLEVEKGKRLQQEELRKKLEKELGVKNKELELKISDINLLRQDMEKAQDKDKKRRLTSEKEKEAVKKEIEQITKQIESQKEEEARVHLRDKLDQFNKDLQSIQSKEEKKRKEMHQALQATRHKLDEKQKEMQEKEKNIAVLRQDISEKNKKLQKNLREEKKKTEELNGL